MQYILSWGFYPYFTLFVTDETTDAQRLTIRILDPDVQLQAARKVLCWLLLCLYYPVYIVLCSYNIVMYDTTNQRLLLQCFNTSIDTSTLVFFTADHFILFVHSSRMFYCFVYFACPCRRLLSATAGCRPPACCLPACCHWEHRSVPFIL